MIDEEATVQREAFWPDEAESKLRPSSHAQDGTATRVQLAAPDVLDARRSRRAARETAERARAVMGKRLAVRVSPLQRHLLIDFVLCAAFASAWSLMQSRPQPAPHAATVVETAAMPAHVAPNPLPAPARAEPPAPASGGSITTADPEPKLATANGSDAAAAVEALCRNDYAAALTRYRALASSQPQAKVYALIADVLAHKLSRSCSKGAPCTSP